MIFRALLLSAVGALAGFHAANAGEATLAPADGKSVFEEDTNLWEVEASIPAWLPQLYITVNNSLVGINESVFIGLDDIVGNFDWIYYFGTDIRYGRFGFMPDSVGLKMTGGFSPKSGRFIEGNYNIKLAVLNLLGYYRVIDKPDFSLDVVGGARYLYSEIGLGLVSAGNVTQSNTRLDVWDAVGGLRVQGNLFKDAFDRKLFYSIYGDAGAGTSKLTWQVWANLGYRFTETFSTSVGYRYLTWEQKARANTVDITGSGPIITFTKQF